ncbi:MAG: diversity-generating retroelement protein Avd, partial [Planctomyces sp.]
MKPGEELPVIREWYELTTWLLPKISKFPRDQKFLLGDRLQSLLLDVLDLLIEAKFRRDRIGVLDQINVQLEKLRFLLRLCHDLGLLHSKAIGDCTQRLLQIGTQIGGW